MSGTDHLDALRRDASSAPVVLFVSRITDVREPVARLDELGIEQATDIETTTFEPPPKRGGGKIVGSVAELVSELKNKGLL